jgi:hypothetical protein
MSSWRRMPAFYSFGLVFIVAMTLATMLFRVAQERTMEATDQRAQAAGTLTEAQKLYLESRLGTSELLFNIAFAIIGSLLALRFSEKTRAELNTHAAFVACALLLASIYSAFLFQIGVSHCLEASPTDMFSSVLSYPIVAQFWFLFVAVILVALSLIRRIPRAGLVAIIGAMLFVTPGCAVASQATPQPEPGCVREWAAARQLELPASAIADATALVTYLVVREEVEVTADDRCAVAGTLLDALRFEVLKNANLTTAAETNEAMAKMLRDALVATQTPNVSLGDLLDEMISIAEIWRVAAGVVEFIDETDGGQLFVTVMSRDRPPKQRNGRTRWIVRLPPGKYDVTASVGATRVYSAEVEVRDGQRKAVTLRGPP